jgi:ABC-type antimicrobial peptide transport system permease subunit
LGVLGFDPLLLGSVAAGLLLVTLLAAAIPARRAARIDPIQALRQD